MIYKIKYYYLGGFSLNSARNITIKDLKAYNNTSNENAILILNDVQNSKILDSQIYNNKITKNNNILIMQSNFIQIRNI